MSCYRDIGVIQSRLEIADGGLGLLERARNIQRRLVERNPEQVDFLRSMAEVMNSLGFVYYYQGNYSAAQRSFEEVQAICSKLLDRVTIGPKPIRYQELLALGSYNTANIQVRNKETGRALKSYERALKFWLSLGPIPSLDRAVPRELGARRTASSPRSTSRNTWIPRRWNRSNIPSRSIGSWYSPSPIGPSSIRAGPYPEFPRYPVRRSKAEPPSYPAVAGGDRPEQNRAIAISSSLREYKFFLTYTSRTWESSTSTSVKSNGACPSTEIPPGSAAS